MRNKKSSQFPEIWRRFKKNKMAFLGLIILALLITVAIFAPLIAPYGYDEQNLQDAMQKMSLRHLLGTDNLGRDIFSRLVYGSRISLFVGLIAVVIGAVIGGLIGSVAAYYGGTVDTVFMRIIDIMMSIPSMVLAITICASLGPGLINTMVAVGFSSVPTYARVVRSAVLTVKQQEYIEASKSLGANTRIILLKHIIPNCMAPIIVQASLGVGNAILSAASMSFIGLGIQPPVPEWGAMLSAGRTYIRNYPQMVIFPGLCIMITIFAINLAGDGLRDALDPRLKQ